MAKREPLGVWLHGRRVAELTNPRLGDVRCRYTEEALDRWPRNTPLLSCSLPLGDRDLQATSYFRGMLPEGQHLQALATAARVPTYDTYGLIARFGRDVAGAAVISVDDPQERPGSALLYGEGQLAAEVSGLEDRPLAIYDDSELSIAGLQSKMLLVATPEGWARPAGGRPSTHILKVEDRRYPGLVTMEAACLRLARAVGLTDVEARVETIADVDCIIVSRFDRIETPAGLERVHQEDACQALGRDAEAQRGAGKYERAGGPTLKEVAGLLDRYSVDGVGELERHVAATVFTALIGNSDAHGKNVGLLHVAPGQIQLAPLYDTVPTAIWPKLSDRAAMTVNGQVTLADVTHGDVVAEASRWPLDAGIASEAATRVAESLLDAASTEGIPEELASLVQDRAERFLSSS